MTKAHILHEIQRTATENGGVPLGSRKFQTETGIGETEWGKLWARWNDAIKEAGLVPNELKKAYTAAELLETYAKLAVELGHLPTNADTRFAARNGLQFPTWEALIRQFGGKPELVGQLKAHCKDRPDLVEVVALCEGYKPRGADRAAEAESSEADLGYVYLIKHGPRREYKIGRTNNALRREGEIRTELPEKVEPVHVIRTDDPAGIEAYWHNRFAGKRKNGEWFELDASDIAAFKRRKFM